ncbi:MAG: hypothetical protein COA58_10545 [Bacteroidetes bacterium]|nr:MAG: hypothetical protein COA58_10545 [Bacteroidota bacterium]
MNDSKLIQKNGVKALTIKNCLENTSCYTDYYEFNSCGKISLEQPSMIGSYRRFEYDSKCRLIKSLGLNYTTDKTKDSVWSKSELEYPKHDSTIVITTHFDDRKLVYQDTTKINERSEPFQNVIRNDKGQILQHSYGNLYYPCGTQILGKHTCLYLYNQNGLISHVEIYNSSNEIVVDLKYEYTK